MLRTVVRKATKPAIRSVLGRSNSYSGYRVANEISIRSLFSKTPYQHYEKSPDEGVNGPTQGPKVEGYHPPPFNSKAEAESKSEQSAVEEPAADSGRVEELQKLLDEANLKIDALEVTDKSDKETIQLLKMKLADERNMMKRWEEKKKNDLKHSHASFAKDVLTVYDNLQRAIDAVAPDQMSSNEHISSLCHGVSLTKTQLTQTYSKYGISVIKAEVGQKFDPELHDAAFHLPVGAIPDVEPDHIAVIQEIGFTIHDRVLRPTKVGVIMS